MQGPTITCVLGNPRSGTTALRNALHHTGLFFDYGEIFHTDRQLTAKPFLDFLEAWPSPVAAMVVAKETVALAKAYLAQLRAERPAIVPLIDIKHNSWGILRPAWRYPHEEPLFLSLLKGRSARFIFIRRRALVDQVISYYVAMQTNKWHSSVSASDIPSAIQETPMDPEFARFQASLFCRAECLIMSFIASYRHKVVLDYDDLFHDDGISPLPLKAISRLMGINIATAPCSLVRNSFDKRNVIRNYAEVCAVVEKVRSLFDERFFEIIDRGYGTDF